MDYLYAQGISFHHSISKNYKFRTIEPLRGKKKPNNNDVSSQSKLTINVYQSRKNIIKQVNADNKFSNLNEILRPISVNIVGAFEHVGDIERSNRTIKNTLDVTCTYCHTRNIQLRWCMVVSLSRLKI